VKWLPQPANFREQLAACSAEADPAARMEQLARLASSRLSYLELIQTDAVLRKSEVAKQSRFEPVRLAILGSHTVDHLLPAIRVAGLRHGFHFETHASGFGQYRQELLTVPSPLSSFEPDVIVFSLGAQDFVGTVPLDASKSDADQAIKAAVEDICVLWREATDRFGATVIQQSFLDTHPAVLGSLDAVAPGARARLVGRLNAELSDCAGDNEVLWLDVARASASDGLDAWFDVARWLQAKMEISPNASHSYGELLARLVGAQRGRSKKCLVLDLDGTLWGGVIGDDGIGGIVLGQGSGAGEAHLALQRYAKILRSRGVILAVCSKNDTTIAEAAFREHPDMLLAREDFSAFIANWGDKAANLERIAAELNIGIDSLVFVDDNPAERERVRNSLPMVATPELPDDPAFYVSTLANAGYFEAVALTDEDAQRSELYASNKTRSELLSSASSIDEFQKQLEMIVDYGPVTSLEIGRVTQLLNKTNQFNTTTIRRSEREVKDLVADPRSIHLQFRLIDKFGDNGIVSAMLLAPADSDTSTMELVNWVMSCRVFGRRLEHESMNILVEIARKNGVQEILADFIATNRNGVVQDLFAQLGFTCVEQLPDRSRWAVKIAEYLPHKTMIQHKASGDG
jgi:FkbH-like protein